MLDDFWILNVLGFGEKHNIKIKIEQRINISPNVLYNISICGREYLFLGSLLLQARLFFTTKGIYLV